MHYISAVAILPKNAIPGEIHTKLRRVALLYSVRAFKLFQS